MTLVAELDFGGRFGAGDEIFGPDLRDLEIAVQGGTAVLFAMNGINGGLSRWQLAGDGSLPQLAGRQLHDQATLRTGDFQLAEVEGELRLLQAQPELTVYRLDAAGAPGSQDRLPPADAAAGKALGAVAGLTLADGQPVVYAVESGSGQLRGWRLEAAGGFGDALPLGGGEQAYRLEPAALLAPVALPGGGAVLLAADGQGVHGFVVEADGGLRAGGTLGAEQGLSVGGVSVLEGFAAGGSAWALLGAAGSGSLCLFRVGADGGLTLEAQLQDSAMTRFGGLSALEVVEVQGHLLVLAAGNDGGLSLLTLTPGGALIHLRSLEHQPGLGLQNVTALEAVVLGAQVQVFASSATMAGISQFTLPLQDLGVLRQAAAAQDRLEGGSGHDVLEGGAARVDLYGHAGDDVLVAGAGGGTLVGGAGADVFVVGPGTGAVTLRDFTPGEDRLDLSLFEGLYGPGQLASRGRSYGIDLELGGIRIAVAQAGGGRLELEDVFGAALRFDFPQRLASGETRPGGSFHGSAGSDRIVGTEGRDGIWGLAGRDHLAGGAGRDTLEGGSGSDTLTGGGGRDRLAGGEDRDLLKGGGARDVLKGGSGRDTVLGGGGQDRLQGQGGRDRLQGGQGNDRLEGGKGGDWLRGGGGEDVFVFGPRHGADRVADFTPGSDLLDLRATAAGGWQDLALQAEDGGTRIETGSGTIFLPDLDPARLDADDFLF